MRTMTRHALLMIWGKIVGCALLLTVSTVASPASEWDNPDRTQQFDLPAGPAERTLANFSRQSEQPAVFPSDQIRGVRTSAVKGDYSPFQALSLMLAGTTLVPSFDEQSGAFVIKKAAPQAANPRPNIGDVVLLPPYEVDAGRGRPWRYVKHGGVEVLFRCPEDHAVAAVDRYIRLNRMLAIILPRHLQPARDVPAALVLEDVDYEFSVTQELKKAIFTDLTEDDDERKATYLPNFHFRDDDTDVFYFTLEHHLGDQSMMTITPAHLQYLLEARNPRLPRWFIDGMMKFLEGIVLPVPSVDQLSRWNSERSFKYPYPYDKITVLPFVWGDSKQTDHIQKAVRAEAKRTSRALAPSQLSLLPMDKLLRGAYSEDQAGDAAATAPLQAALFLRWIFDPKPATPAADQLLRPGPKPSANDLWKFLDRCEQEEFSEKLFTECFGWTYAEMDTLMRSYLPYAILKRRSSGFTLSSNEPVEKLAKLDHQLATVPQIARLRGRLNRLSIRYVKQFYPQLTPAYIEQARRTLQRGIDTVESDAELIAESALCEVEAGNDEAALPLLQAAAEAGVIHPRIYYELGRIQLGRVRAADAQLATSTVEIDQIADQLLNGLKQQPSLPQSYELLFELWLRRNSPLTPTELAVLDEGGRLFPERFRIVYAAMLLYAAQGNSNAALALGIRSLPSLIDPDQHERVEQLLRSLES